MFHGASNLFGSLSFVTETIHVYSFINIMNTKFRLRMNESNTVYEEIQGNSLAFYS